MGMLLSVGAVILGSIGVLRDASLLARGHSRIPHFRWEIFGLVAALFSYPFGGIILRNEKIGLVGVGFGSVIVVFALLTTVVFFSRLRPLTEGFAAITLGILATITGFTIGVFLAPIAFALGFASLRHSRREGEIAVNPSAG
jgi:hypothetical protein